MYRTNTNCNDCNHYYKIVWNCKKNSLEKDWLYLCYNCIRLNKYLYGRCFKSQVQNIKSYIRCSLKPTKLELPFHELPPTPKDSKVY